MSPLPAEDASPDSFGPESVRRCLPQRPTMQRWTFSAKKPSSTVSFGPIGDGGGRFGARFRPAASPRHRPATKKQAEISLYLLFIFGGGAENPRVRFANPHRLRAPVGALARGLQTLRVLHRVRFSAVRTCNKKQAGVFTYLLVTIGGGAENRTPVHESPLIGISKLSRWFDLGRVARSDTLAASQPVRS